MMKQIIQTILIGTLALTLASRCTMTNMKQSIDRKAVVERNRVITNAINPKSPAQVGNGEFAFGVDITGLQTFVPFNSLSQWSWVLGWKIR